jgi:regulator of protease activity HflC (stomatin/prohibitin superfamily)
MGDKVPQIFRKYRRDLEDIEDGFLKTAVFEAYRIVANSYKADMLISSRQEFDAKVKKELQDQLSKEGFILAQFTSSLVYPDGLKNAINVKNKAVQDALMTENKVRQAKAQADIQIATAEGNAKSMILNAEAEAKSNQLRQTTLTPMLLQQQWIEAWKHGGSKVPTYITNGGEKFMMNIK